jgi:rare lipoprotein A (peptidoglycan hydrolase)
MARFAGQRAATVAGVVILVAAIVFAVVRLGDHKNSLPQPTGQRYTALAASYAPSAQVKGACGIVIDAKTLGVAHPVLPCGVQIYIEYKGKQVLTQVVDRGPNAPGREFALTVALADLLHLDGTQQIRWRFAS